MATIRKRNGKYQAQVRTGHLPPEARPFTQRADAVAWARRAELARERAGITDRSRLRDTLGQILDRYVAEITPRKRGADTEKRRLSRLRKERICDVPLAELTSEVIALFRDRRITAGRRACLYDLVLIQHALTIARKEWGYPLERNPADLVSKPKLAAPRNRRLMPGEYERLQAGCDDSRASYLWPLINVAIETAMRRSEILGLCWENVSLERRTAYLRMTKNGESRVVPLSPQALHWLAQLRGDSRAIVPATEVAVRQAWERLVARTGIKGLTFHDLRHEAISRFFERGLALAEVALISGHKTPAMLFRYTHLRAEDVAAKLAGEQTRVAPEVSPDMSAEAIGSQVSPP